MTAYVQIGVVGSTRSTDALIALLRVGLTSPQYMSKAGYVLWRV
jgi:hypothetical protein